MSTLENKIKKVMPITDGHDQVLNLIFTPDEEKLPIIIDIEIPIKNGVGKADFGWKPTFGGTIKATAEITAPGEGTWNGLVYDMVAKKYILEAHSVKKGEKVELTSYKTNFLGIRPVVNVKWSHSGDTTLKVHLVINIG
jgi:hypothetical protein